jgi:glutathione S-transferase
MLTLYYSPGACSLASHIALEETQEPYEAKQTLLSKDEHKTEAYLKINPRGKVPSLSVDGDIITENTAILTYLGKRFPKAEMWPTDPIEEARCISQMAWFSNTPHISQRGMVRPYRFVSDEAMHTNVKALAKSTYWENVSEIEEFLGAKTWMMGDQYTVCDPYALVFYGWGIRAGLPMDDLRAFTAFKDRMFQRPAVRKVVEREQTPYIASFL